MPAVIWYNRTNLAVDGKDKKAVVEFMEKLSRDDTTPGLHIEPIKRSVDKRVRTGRINQFLRAVLIKLVGGADGYYVFYGVYPHDKAIDVAAKVSAEVDSLTGAVRVIETEDVPDLRGSSISSTAPTATMSSPGSFLDKRGFTVESLVDQFHLPRKLAEQALAAMTDAELIELAEDQPSWIVEVIVGLSVGDSVSQILTAIASDDAPSDDEDRASDAAILHALRSERGRADYVFIEDQDELRRVIEDGSMGAWRTFLHPEQRKYVEKHYRGPARLSGAAGTGKTVVLLHRAAHLIAEKPKARVLLTTFTKTLAEGLSEQLAFLDPEIPQVELGAPGVAVLGVDATVANVLRAAVRINRDELAAAVEAVLGSPRPDVNGVLTDISWEEAAAGQDLSFLPGPAVGDFLESEYNSVVLPKRIVDAEQYLRVRRAGRGQALDRAKRRAVWAAIEQYRESARFAGGLTFSERAAVAAEWLIRSGTTFADHVLVDEGQDLSAVQWQFLRALVPEGANDLFIAEDSEQRIYAENLVLSHYGIGIVGRSRRLTLSYRTTAQNLGRAMKALEGAAFPDLEGSSHDTGEAPRRYRAARTGPVPVEMDAAYAETGQVVVSTVREWVAGGAKLEEIGVLVVSNKVAESYAADLMDEGFQAQTRPGKKADNSISVLTMHRAKGLEFPYVVVVVPREMQHAGAQTDVAKRDLSLLYVAMSRARDEMVVLRQV